MLDNLFYRCSTPPKTFHEEFNLNGNQCVQSRIKLDDFNNKNSFCCVSCDKLFHLKSELDHHLRSKCCDKIVKCKCSDISLSNVTLKARVKKIIHTVNSNKTDDKEKFICADCTECYYRKHDLEQHIRIKHLPSGFSCDCGKKFNRRVCLEFHKERQHKENYVLKDLYCHRCNIYFKNELELKKHNVDNKCSNEFVAIKLDANNQLNSLERIGSNKEVFSDCSVNSEDIRRHLDVPQESEKNEKQVFPCTICGHKYSRKFDMLKHRVKSHSEEQRANDPFELTVLKKKKNSTEKKVQCNDCGKLYVRKRDLMKHQQRKHLGGSNTNMSVRTIDHMNVDVLKGAEMEINGSIIYHCSLCGKNIMTKRGYIRHVRIHTGERPFTCHICGKQFRSSTDLTRHLRCVHDGIKNYSCDICGRCFANKGTRNDHRRIHTGERPYVCDICGKAFPTPNSIYVHRRIHTDYFPHQCTSCDKRFRRRQQLVHHVRTHTGEKPHACEICGKCFGVKDELSRHRLTHSTEKPHACPLCGLCFGQKRYLKNHIRTHHGDLTVKT
ncbi:uncharacterized protein LOC142324620 [Lycorma delicatula]|uniref:uncharacterized protein LOC142324620 n=1 Tax=Lycorma delicatula TaxID=130591 RepID=UPI003F50E4BB